MPISSASISTDCQSLDNIQTVDAGNAFENVDPTNKIERVGSMPAAMRAAARVRRRFNPATPHCVAQR
jgi:hypothetical protein